MASRITSDIVMGMYNTRILVTVRDAPKKTSNRSVGPIASWHGSYGDQKENLIERIALANRALRGVDQPNIWHGNTR